MHKQTGTTHGKVPLYETEEFSYILFREVPEKYKKEFGEWMYGQTCLTMNHELVIYSWDWERWYDLKTKNIPTYFD